MALEARSSLQYAEEIDYMLIMGSMARLLHNKGRQGLGIVVSEGGKLSVRCTFGDYFIQLSGKVDDMPMLRKIVPSRYFLIKEARLGQQLKSVLDQIYNDA